jgi:hypothetical protein
MMSDDLNLTLDPVRKKPKDRTPLLIALIVIAIAVAAIDLALHLGSGGGGGMEPADLERLALKLEKQELFSAAEEAWIEYLTAASPDPGGKARIWYRIGRMREQSGDCESALAAYYRSERISALPELEQEISMAAERCLTRLSRFAALRSELAARTSVGAEEGDESEVLAEIGAEKITREMLNAMIEAEVDAQVAQVAAGMPADQVRAQREKILEQVMQGNELGQWLERLVAEELLFRYAMEEGLHEDPEIVEMSRRIERKLLTGQVLAREYSASVTVTEDEMRAWYDANGAKIAGNAGLEGGEVPPFDDVRDQVYAAVRMEKEMAVQSELLEKLTDRYDVVIHNSRLGGERRKEQQQ